MNIKKWLKKKAKIYILSVDLPRTIILTWTK